MNKEKKIIKRCSFKKGFLQVRQVDADKVREEIMNGLGIKTRSAWMLRLNGRIEPRVSEAQLIEATLNRYGVTDIWGD
jgi:hypothetical protein